MSEMLLGVIIGGMLGELGAVIGIAGGIINSKVNADAQRRREHEARIHARRDLAEWAEEAADAVQAARDLGVKVAELA